MKRDTHRGPVPGLSKRTHAIRHTFRLLLELYAAPRSCLSHHPALFNTSSRGFGRLFLLA